MDGASDHDGPESLQQTLEEAADFVEELIGPNVILTDQERDDIPGQPDDDPLDPEDVSVSDGPVEDETVRAARSSCFRVEIQKPRGCVGFEDVRERATSLAAQFQTEMEACRNRGPQIVQNVCDKNRLANEALVKPPASAQQEFVDLRNQLSEGVAPDEERAVRTKASSWCTESRYAGDGPRGCTHLVARAVTRGFGKALRERSAAVMPLVAVAKRGLVPDISGDVSQITSKAEEGCQGDDCLCSFIPQYWPFLMRCCLRIVTHKYVLPNGPLAEQLSQIVAGSSSLTFGLMQVRKTRLAAQSVWAQRFILGQLPIYFTMAKNITQSKWNIKKALAEVNEEIRSFLTSEELGLFLRDDRSSLSIFEAVPVDNLHIIPMVRDLPGDREYDPLCVQQVIVRCGRADMVTKTVEFEGDLVKSMMAPLLEAGQIMRVTSLETREVLYPIAAMFDEWDLCRQAFRVEKGGRPMIGALDRAVFRGVRDGCPPLVESIAVVAGITATPFAVLGLQTKWERPLQVVLLAPEQGTYYGLPFLADDTTVQYREVEVVSKESFAVPRTSRCRQLEKHPALLSMLEDMCEDYRAFQLNDDLQPPNSHVHGLAVTSIYHKDHMKVASECLAHFETEGVPAIALVDDHGARDNKKTGMTLCFPDTLVQADIPQLFLLPGLNEQGQLDFDSTETLWTDAIVRSLPELLQQWLVKNNAAIRATQLRHLAKYPNEVLFPGHRQADMRCYALQLEWELMWHPTLWKLGTKGFVMLTVAGDKANRANAYKTVFHLAQLTHAYFYTSMEHEGANAEHLLQKMGRICTTQYGAPIVRPPKLYLSELVKALLKSCQILYKRIWQRLAEAKASGQPIDQDIIHNQQFKRELAALVARHSQKLKVSRRDINDGVFAGHTAVCKDGVVVRIFKSDVKGPESARFCALESEFPLDQVDVLDASAVEAKLREMSDEAARQYTPEGQPTQRVLDITRQANRAVFFPVSSLFEIEKNPLDPDDYYNYMERNDYRIVLSKKDKYVDAIRCAITQALVEQGHLTDEERSFLGGKKLVNVASFKQDLGFANVCPFAHVAVRTHVKVVARIVGVNVLALIPNPEFLDKHGRGLRTTEVDELMHGDMITRRFVLRLPLEMEEGLEPRDYGGALRLMVRWQRGFRQVEISDEEYQVQIDKQAQPERRFPRKSGKRRAEPSGAPRSGKRPRLAEPEPEHTEQREEDPGKRTGRRRQEVHYKDASDIESDSDTDDDMPLSGKPRIAREKPRPVQKRAAFDTLVAVAAKQVKTRKLDDLGKERSQDWEELIKEASSLHAKKGRQMKELVGKAIDAIRESSLIATTQVKVMGSLHDAEKKLRQLNVATAYRNALKEVLIKYGGSSADTTDEESSSSFSDSLPSEDSSESGLRVD